MSNQAQEFKMFEEGIKPGVLILVEPDDLHRWLCSVWFDFTMGAMRKIKPGDLIAVQNFNSKGKSIFYSVLRLVSVQPQHYALTGEDLKAYPGNIVESARNIMPDFLEQESEVTEDVTKISCTAVPIDIQFLDDGNAFSTDKMSRDESVPITGSDVHLISEKLTEMIYNGSLNIEQPDIVRVGQLSKSETININISAEELMKLHFGLFGFTGAGKSNLVSTILSSVLNESEINHKFVLFDIMDEYTGLLMDQLLNPSVNGMLISLGLRYLPESVITYLSTDTRTEQMLDTAANDILRGMLLPKGLRPDRNSFLPAVKRLLQENKIRVIDLMTTTTVEQFSETFWNDVFTEEIRGPTRVDLDRDLNNIFRSPPTSNQIMTPALAQQLITNATNLLRPSTQNWQSATGMDRTYNTRMNMVIGVLQDFMNLARINIPENIRYSVDQIISELNNEGTKSLMILTSDDPNVMRQHARRIGNAIYGMRSRRAISSPIVSFVFDEADEFIPSGAAGTYAESRQIVETLARRGRKFGLGVGIATQRITYLDTNIMGQPHTYFISKLPRDYDRNTVADAFGLGKEDMQQTLQLKKGEWILISHDATGLDGVPMPIKTDNAEERIRRFIQQMSPI